MLCIHWVLFAQNRVYTWFIGCMRFGVDGDAAADAVAAAAVIVIVSVWFLMPRYVYVYTNFMKYHCEHPAALPQRFFPLNHFSIITPRSLFLSEQIVVAVQFDVIRYDTICYVKVDVRLRVC